MAMSENSRKVIEYLRTVNGKDITAANVAETLGLGKQSVNGIFTSAIQRKGFGFREEAEIELEDGTHSKVKYLRLTDEGMNVDLDADAE